MLQLYFRFHSTDKIPWEEFQEFYDYILYQSLEESEHNLFVDDVLDGVHATNSPDKHPIHNEDQSQTIGVSPDRNDQSTSIQCNKYDMHKAP